MSLLTTVEADTEAALTAIGQFIDTTVWPDLKKFLTLFTPLEAKSILSDLVGAVPVAKTDGVPAAAAQVGTELGPQTLQNAETAAGGVLTATATQDPSTVTTSATPAPATNTASTEASPTTTD